MSTYYKEYIVDSGYVVMTQHGNNHKHALCPQCISVILASCNNDNPNDFSSHSKSIKPLGNLKGA